MKTSPALWISFVAVILIAVVAPAVIAQTSEAPAVQQTPASVQEPSPNIAASKSEARRQLADTRSQKRLQLANGRKTARSDCFQTHPNDPAAARDCVRSTAKSSTKNNTTTQRDTRTACQKQSADGAAIQTCITESNLRKLSGPK